MEGRRQTARRRAAEVDNHRRLVMHMLYSCCPVDCPRLVMLLFALQRGAKSSVCWPTAVTIVENSKGRFVRIV